MTLKRLLVSILLQLFLLSSNPVLAEGEPGFALYLYRSGEYQSAVTELERFVYDNPEDPFVPIAHYLVALSHAHTGQYRKAVVCLEKLIDPLETAGNGEPVHGLVCECYLQLLNLHFRERSFSDFEVEAARYAASCSDSDASLDAWVRNLELAVHVYKRNWEEAAELVHGANHLTGDERERFDRGIRQIQEYRFKYPVLGGVLSVLPGLGYLYAGRPMESLRSFFINAAGIGLTVFCFVTGMPVLGAVFGMVEAALYVTNIYGGVNAVMQGNAQLTIEMRDNLLRDISIPPLDALTIRREIVGP